MAGITSKLVNENYMMNFAQKWYVLFFYVLNFVMVAIDFILYFRNKRLDNKEKKYENYRKYQLYKWRNHRGHS